MTAADVASAAAGGLGVAATAVPLAALLLPRTGIASRACVCWVLAATAVVLPLQVLSPFHALTRGWVLAAQTVLALLSGAAWALCGRPALLPVLPDRPWARLRDSPGGGALLVLLAVAATAIAGEALLAVLVAPNEADTLGYHLVRAGYWLQDRSALQYQPNLDDPAQVQPAVAELMATWLMALTRSDRLVQLVQWGSLLACAAGIAALARRLGAGRSGAVGCAGLFAVTPIALLESSTGQNDLVLTAALLAGTVLLVDGLRSRSLRLLALAGLALGLALGTKLTASLALVLLGAVGLAVLVRLRAGVRFTLVALAVVTATALPAGGFVYAQNVVNLGRVTGFSGTPQGDFVQSDPVTDTIRAGATLIDASGLPVPHAAQQAVRVVERPLFRGVHGDRFGAPDPPVRTEPVDDESGYGLTGLLVGLPLLLATAVRRREAPARRTAAVCALAFTVGVASLLGYSPEDARYLMPAAAVAAALLGGPLAGRARWALLVIAVATVPGTLLLSSNKSVLPTHGDPSVLAVGRVEQQTQDPDQRALLHRLDALAGPRGDVGLVSQDALSDYLVMGGPSHRRVVTFQPSDLKKEHIRNSHVRGVLIAAPDQSPCDDGSCRPGPGVLVTPLPGGAVWLTVGR